MNRNGSRRRRLLFAWCLAALASWTALAAGPPDLPLGLAEAEEQALKSHPEISIAELRTLLAREGVTEARAPLFPMLTGYATLVDTDGENDRVAAGGLNNPIIYDRFALGLGLGWQLFDFGRTANLLASARFKERAEEKGLEGARTRILALVDVAYFAALQAHAVRQVAGQTLATRQLLLDQVAVLATNQLKSELDVSFAETALAEARVLVSRAENDDRTTQTRLATLVGIKDGQTRRLVDQPLPPAVPEDASSLVTAALARRPELARLRLELDAAERFARAERALHFPTVTGIAAGGVLPEHNPKLPDNYLAAGLNVSLPLFAGLQHEARRKAAGLKARILAETLREQEDNVIRDVRIAWLDARTASERVQLTTKLAATAGRAFALAEAKYKAGATSVAELGQAQLNLTTAQIAEATARYDLMIQQALLDFQVGITGGKAQVH